MKSNVVPVSYYNSLLKVCMMHARLDQFKQFCTTCSYKFAVHCFATVKLSDQAIITTVSLLNIQ